MDSIRHMTIDELLGATASASVAPAAGSNVAITAAVGGSLIEMATVHGDFSRTEDDPDPATLRARAHETRDRLLDLADRDADLVDRAFDADDERPRPEPTALLEVPLRIGECCLELLDVGREVRDRGAGLVTADATCGCWLVAAAGGASVAIGRTNLPMVATEERRVRFRDRIEALEGTVSDAVADLQDGPGSSPTE